MRQPAMAHIGLLGFLGTVFRPPLSPVLDPERVDDAARQLVATSQHDVADDGAGGVGGDDGGMAVGGV